MESFDSFGEINTSYTLVFNNSKYGELPYCTFTLNSNLSITPSFCILNTGGRSYLTCSTDDNIIDTIESKLPTHELPIFRVLSKIFDEGIFKISHVVDTKDLIDNWLEVIGATNISFQKNVNLGTKKGVKQFSTLSGVFKLKRM